MDFVKRMYLQILFWLAFNEVLNGQPMYTNKK